MNSDMIKPKKLGHLHLVYHFTVPLSKEHDFTAVTAEQHRQSCIRDAFINGLYSKEIQQRLSENMTLTLDQAFQHAISLEMAYKNSETYSQLYPSSAAAKKNNL